MGKPAASKTKKRINRVRIYFAAESDDALIEKFLEEGELTPEEIYRGLKIGVIKGAFVPVLCGAAANHAGPIGASLLLDAINAGFRNVRAPQGLAPLKFRLPDGGESVYVLMAMRNITAELLAFAREQFKSNVPAPVYGPVPQPKQETKPSAETNNEEKEDETMKTKTTQNNQTPTAEAAAPGSAGALTGESVPETTAETTATETAEADANTASAIVPPAVMQFPTSADPIQDLLTELNGIQDAANEVLNRLRGLRQKARNVERHYRGKAKEIEAKSQLIAKFQKAVSL